jgi:V/A-type H+-transporting ATPase subunit E
MPEELQSLLEKINEEGVKKAEETKNKIISDAGLEAEKIISDAKTKADEIVRKAQIDADTVKSRGEAAVRQAVRDIVITLQGEILNRFKSVVKEATADAMTPDLMGKIIIEMVKNYNLKNPSGEADIELILAQKDIDSMEKLFKTSLVNSLKKNPYISFGQNFAAGVKISFKGDDVFFDFSDEAISDMICAYVGPRLAAVINPEKKK